MESTPFDEKHGCPNTKSVHDFKVEVWGYCPMCVGWKAFQDARVEGKWLLCLMIQTANLGMLTEGASPSEFYSAAPAAELDRKCIESRDRRFYIPRRIARPQNFRVALCLSAVFRKW